MAILRSGVACRDRRPHLRLPPQASHLTPYASMLQSHSSGSVLTLTLDRPEVRNALSGELVEQLTEALEAAGRDDAVRCCDGHGVRG